MRLERWTKILVLVCAAALSSLLPAQAQNPFSPARFVNGNIITHYEIDQRERLLRALGVPPTTIPQMALTQLTEDVLKREQAVLLGMNVPDESYSAAIEQYAAQRQMSVGGLESRMSSAGVSSDTLRQFISTGIMWREIVRARFTDRAQPTETDLRNIMNVAASSGQESVFLREIAIAFAEHGVAGSKRIADRIRQQVSNGASFAGLARQYSRSRSRNSGGSLGWAPANRLPPPVASRVLTLERGAVSEPLEVPAGIILFQLVDIREDKDVARNDVLVTYVRLDLPITDGTGDQARTQANQLARDIDTCDQATAMVDDFGGLSGTFGPQFQNALPDEVSTILMALDAGESSHSVAGPDTLSFFHLCRRSVDTDPEQMDALRTQILNQRLNRFADDYLSELMADAYVREGS